MASYVPTELQAYGDLLNPPSKSSTPTGDLVGIYQGIPVYANKPIDPVYTGSDQDGNAFYIDKNTGAGIHGNDDGSYSFNGNGGEDSGNGSQNLSGLDPSKLLSGATLGKVDWNYQSVRGGMGASGNNSTAINALWGGSSYPNGRVTDWAHIDPTQKQANFTAGQTRDALWNVYDNLSAQGKTPAKNPDEIALQLAADNGATNYSSAGNIAGYGAGANTLGLAQTISAVFMNQPQVVSVTQHPYTVSPQSIADATTFGEAHSTPNVINTLNTFVDQGKNGPDYLGAAIQAGALAMAGGALYSGALSGLGGATVGTSSVAATTAGIANTTLAGIGAGAAVGGISAAINGGDIAEGALKGAFSSALGAVVSPAAQELVKASNGAINLQVAQAAVQAATVAAKAGLTGGDVTKAITNSLEASAISAGLKGMNVPSDIAKIVTPIAVTGLNNGDVNAAIQNSLTNYASGFVKSAISPPATPLAEQPSAPVYPEYPKSGPTVEPPPALPTYNTDITPTSTDLPSNLSTIAPSTSPIVSTPIDVANANTPTEAITTPANLPTAPDEFNLAPGTTINEQGKVVATGIPTAIDVPSTLDAIISNNPTKNTLDTIDVNAPGGIAPATDPSTGALPVTALPITEPTIPADTVPQVDMSAASFLATDPTTGNGIYTLDGKLVNADGSEYTGDSNTNMFVNGSPTDTTPAAVTPTDTIPADTTPAIDMSNAVFIATDPVTGAGVYTLDGKLVNADGSAYTGDYSTTAPATTPTVETPKPEDHVYVGGNAEPTTPTETAPTASPTVEAPTVEDHVYVGGNAEPATPATPSATGSGGALPTATTTAATPTQQTSTTQSTAAPAATPAVAPLSYLTPTMLAGAPVTPQMTAQVAQLKQLYPQLQGVSDKILSSLIASEPKTAADNSSQLMSSGLSSMANTSPSTASRGSLVGQDANSNLMQAGLSMLNPGSSLATPHFAKGGHVEDHIPEFITGATGHYVKGRGDGQSDDIPAMLADGEYVFDADTVAALGNGSSDAGAKALDKMRESIRKHKRAAPVNKIPPKAKSPLEYFKGR